MVNLAAAKEAVAAGGCAGSASGAVVNHFYFCRLCVWDVGKGRLSSGGGDVVGGVYWFEDKSSSY